MTNDDATAEIEEVEIADLEEDGQDIAAEDVEAAKRPRRQRRRGLRLPKVKFYMPQGVPEETPPKPDYSPDSLSRQERRKIERRAKRDADREAKRKRQQATDDWDLRQVLDHVTITKNGRMQAWYLLEPQRWAFQSIRQAEHMIEDHARRYADLMNYGLTLRVTTRPYPLQDALNTAFDNAPEPTEGFNRILERDYEFYADTNNDDKLVYLGVEFGNTPGLVRQASKYSKNLRDKMNAAIEARVTRIDKIMDDDGMDAIPAVGNDMAWLLARSFGLGCPAPLPTSGRTEWDSSDLAEFIAGVKWTQEPLSPLRVDSVRGDDGLTTRYVQVLSLGTMHDMEIPEEEVPWIARTEELPFGVEWVGHLRVEESEKTRTTMEKQIDKINGQVEHYEVDHDKTPPKQLARQAMLAEDVEDDLRAGMKGLTLRTRGQYRIAVPAESQEQLNERVSAVKALFEPGIYPEKTLGNYELGKEFVPGQFPVTNDFVHHLTVKELAAGLPAATSEVGDKRGVPIGKTAGLSERLVTFDPWYLPEVAERSGLIPVCGTLGSGKSSFVGMMIYKTVHGGVPWSVMDPSGRLTKLARMSDLRGLAREINILNSDAGSLNPYALVPDPRIEWFLDEEDPQGELERAIRAAYSQRRSLVIDTLKSGLPPMTLNTRAADQLLRNAVQETPADRSTVLGDLMAELKKIGGEEANNLFNRMKELEEHEQGRLFFGEHGEREADDLASIDYRLQIYSLKGLAQPRGDDTDRNDWSTEERLARPILSLASWATVQMVYRTDPNERKGVAIDEAQEVTAVASGRQLTTKISTDTRKHDIAALVSTQNAGPVLGADINNFVGAAVVGRTEGEDEQSDALKMLKLTQGVGYEEDLASLSPRPRKGQTDRQSFANSYREYIFSDGIGGMEKINVKMGHHPELADALDTTPDSKKRTMNQVDDGDAA